MLCFTLFPVLYLIPHFPVKMNSFGFVKCNVKLELYKHCLFKPFLKHTHTHTHTHTSLKAGSKFLMWKIHSLYMANLGRETYVNKPCYFNLLPQTHILFRFFTEHTKPKFLCPINSSQIYFLFFLKNRNSGLLWPLLGPISIIPPCAWIKICSFLFC